MGIKEKRAKHKEEFRRQILDSARELFIKDGYERFSMRNLAKKIDYSPTTIYLYFKGKDYLLIAICEEFFEQFFTELKYLRSVSTNPIETLRQAFLYLVEFGLKNPNQYKVIFFTRNRVYGTYEEFLKKESMARNTYFVFREMVHDCIEAGRLSQVDVDVIANSIAIASHGIVAVALYNPDMLNDKGNSLAGTLVDALLRGYQK
jgi:AcrR family transcriptional regulator